MYVLIDLIQLLPMPITYVPVIYFQFVTFIAYTVKKLFFIFAKFKARSLKLESLRGEFKIVNPESVRNFMSGYGRYVVRPKFSV